MVISRVKSSEISVFRWDLGSTRMPYVVFILSKYPFRCVNMRIVGSLYNLYNPNRALNFTYPPLALSSATFHSRLKTELFKISYPGSTSAPRHVRHHHLLQP